MHSVRHFTLLCLQCRQPARSKCTKYQCALKRARNIAIFPKGPINEGFYLLLLNRLYLIVFPLISFVLRFVFVFYPYQEPTPGSSNQIYRLTGSHIYTACVQDQEDVYIGSLF